MIAVELEGRLGNQLFQYAFIYATARRLNVKFYLDKNVEEFIPAKYFNLKHDALRPLDEGLFAVAGFKNIFRFHLKRRFYRLLNAVFLNRQQMVIGNNEEPAEAIQKLQDKRMYKGYFQSERYFEEVKVDLKQLLTIKPSYRQEFERILSGLTAGPKAVIHIRRGDYSDLNMALPISYYKKALSHIADNNMQYVFISDDPGYVEKEFAFVRNKYISTHDEITDLQFLMNADVCVLSCSSFSWWGAWLNNKPGKVVYAPKNWLGYNTAQEYPTGISYNQSINWITA
ncbi:alpha-1,2-fucosyltransferase [Mucilaginibacter terrenus]|uniref:Alpha-1,2-fucosyltransferase n=1 Tax=Mucilaginibacter terrenus TaxID=2482727 RepID=A0A3E2NMN5_9SPHI|nr:alpha-1,2-fucosyltransferase [Mucilaginibacter terrenus]RFZ82231.1 alpha-1,2-fucosyltransferase [Mucilaginibacter terrenus]